MDRYFAVKPKTHYYHPPTWSDGGGDFIFIPKKNLNDKKNYSFIIFSILSSSYLSAETVAYKLKGELKSRRI